MIPRQLERVKPVRDTAGLAEPMGRHGPGGFLSASGRCPGERGFRERAEGPGTSWSGGQEHDAQEHRGDAGLLNAMKPFAKHPVGEQHGHGWIQRREDGHDRELSLQRGERIQPHPGESEQRRGKRDTCVSRLEGRTQRCTPDAHARNQDHSRNRSGNEQRPGNPVTTGRREQPEHQTAAESREQGQPEPRLGRVRRLSARPARGKRDATYCRSDADRWETPGRSPRTTPAAIGTTHRSR